nr:MAG TPA: hypothetical protein [Caudoviricetes sp.]
MFIYLKLSHYFYLYYITKSPPRKEALRVYPTAW